MVDEAHVSLRLLELDDHIVHSKAVAGASIYLGHNTLLFCAQDVFHLHRLDGAQCLTFLHFLTHFDIDFHDQARHRAQQHFRGIRRQLFWHQLGQFCRARAAHMHLEIRATVANAESTGHFATF